MINTEVELGRLDKDAEIARLRQALKEIAGRARLELDHPLDQPDIALSLIEKTALAVL